MRWWIAIAITGLLLPASAAGQVTDCVAPPGTAATEQYCEKTLSPGTNPDRPARLPKRTEDAFGRAEFGPAALSLIGSYEVAERAPKDRDGRILQPASSAVGAVGSSIGELPLLGGGLFWVALAILLAMAAWRIAERRARD